MGGENWEILHGDTLKLVKAFEPAIFDVIQNNSHKCFSSKTDETMRAFFEILQSREMSPEQRADILLNGIV